MHDDCFSTSGDVCYTNCHHMYDQHVCLIKTRKEAQAGLDPTTVIGVSVGAVVLLLVVAVGAVVFIWQRKKSKRETEEERTDFNPVYATYEVHDDPSAEVKTSVF